MLAYEFFDATVTCLIQQINVSMNVDINGNVNVDFINPETESEYEFTIVKNQRLGEEELRRIIDRAEARNKKIEEIEEYIQKVNVSLSGYFGRNTKKTSYKQLIINKCQEILQWVKGNFLLPRCEYVVRQLELENFCNLGLKKFNSVD